MDKQEIIRRVLRNEAAACELLVRQYQKLVYGTCFRLLRNQSDAEDLSQEVFMEVFRSLVHLRNSEDLSAWIFRISYSKCISFMRKKNPARARGDQDPDQQEGHAGKQAGGSDTKSPLEVLEEKEAAALLFKKIDQLPEKQKRAILLHKFEGYSHREICEKMGLSQASVESLIYRAKASLRRSLHNFYHKS